MDKFKEKTRYLCVKDKYCACWHKVMSTLKYHIILTYQ